MGLDNGIVMKCRKELMEKTIDNDWILKEWTGEQNCEDAFDYWFGITPIPAEHGYEYEITYWRKCWCLRSAIAEVISGKFYDGGDTELSVTDLIWVRQVLIDYMTGKREWIPDIWTLHDMLPVFAHDVARLSWVISFMQEYPGLCNCYFYDSY